MLAAVNTPKGKPRPRLRDFLFFAPPAKPQTWQDQLAIARHVTALLGGSVQKSEVRSQKSVTN